MTPEQTVRAIDIMQDSHAGLKVQARLRSAQEAWKDCIPEWQWAIYDYRIKPTPREWWISPPEPLQECEWAGSYRDGFIKVREVCE